jgi:hypothetical protein
MNASQSIPLQLTKQELINVRVAYCKQLTNIELVLEERGNSNVCLLSHSCEQVLANERASIINRIAEIDAETYRVASLE